MKKLLPLISIIFVILSSCGQPQTRVAHELWFKQTKAAILQQSAMEQPDSVWFSYNQDSSYKTIWQYHDNHLIAKKGFQHDLFRVESFYSKDGLFELRREICENGNTAFEGIFYKTKAYGLSTSYDCHGTLISQGVSFNGEKIGNWKTWKVRNETPTEEIYGNQLPLDSFPRMKK